jgi:hypothetical protein
VWLWLWLCRVSLEVTKLAEHMHRHNRNAHRLPLSRDVLEPSIQVDMQYTCNVNGVIEAKYCPRRVWPMLLVAEDQQECFPATTRLFYFEHEQVELNFCTALMYSYLYNCPPCNCLLSPPTAICCTSISEFLLLAVFSKATKSSVQPIWYPQWKAPPCLHSHFWRRSLLFIQMIRD